MIQDDGKCDEEKGNEEKRSKQTCNNVRKMEDGMTHRPIPINAAPFEVVSSSSNRNENSSGGQSQEQGN